MDNKNQNKKMDIMDKKEKINLKKETWFIKQSKSILAIYNAYLK